MEPTNCTNILYHYTSPDALISILEHKKIWVTHYSFLNDKEELINSLQLLSEMSNNSELNVEAAINFLKTAPFNIAVFSLSSEKNSLSQWRSYCPSTGGYAIGFNRKRLNSILKKRRFHELTPCVYDKSEQKEMISNFIKDFPPADYNSEEFKKYAINISEFIGSVGLRIKHKGFNEEHEWRAISETMDIKFKTEGIEWKIRNGIHNLIQFVEVDLSEDFPIEEIIIGPCRDVQLAKDSVDRALRIYNYNEFSEISVKTETSDIPYRSI